MFGVLFKTCVFSKNLMIKPVDLLICFVLALAKKLITCVMTYFYIFVFSVFLRIL